MKWLARWLTRRRARKARLPAPCKHAVVPNNREMKSLFRYHKR